MVFFKYPLHLPSLGTRLTQEHSLAKLWDVLFDTSDPEVRTLAIRDFDVGSDFWCSVATEETLFVVAKTASSSASDLPVGLQLFDQMLIAQGSCVACARVGAAGWPPVAHVCESPKDRA